MGTRSRWQGGIPDRAFRMGTDGVVGHKAGSGELKDQVRLWPEPRWQPVTPLVATEQTGPRFDCMSPAMPRNPSPLAGRNHQAGKPDLTRAACQTDRQAPDIFGTGVGVKLGNERNLSRAARVGLWPAVVVATGAVSMSVLSFGSAAAASTHTSKITLVSTSKGKVLSDGKTVYILKPSSKPCTSACLKVWPAVTVPNGVKHVAAGSGVTTSKLGTVKVPGVGLQVTYGGKRLYRFVGDTRPGQVNGNITDAWGKWTAVVVSKSTSSGTGSSSGSTPTTGSSNAGSGGTSF
jgi:predicted lipoprotein with Yx(FWY)xxD motif